MKKQLLSVALVSATLIGSAFASETMLSGSGMPGSDRDEHGCIPSAGYVWSGSIQQCVRPWEHNNTGARQEIKDIKEKAKDAIKENRQEAKEEKKDYREAFRADYGYVRNYFTKLTDKDARAERKTTVEAAVKVLLSEKNKLNAEYRLSVKNKTPMTAEAVKARVDTMIAVFYNAVSKYVDATKKDSFDAFVAGKTELYNKIFTINQLTKEKNQKIKADVKSTINTIKTNKNTSK